MFRISPRRWLVLETRRSLGGEEALDSRRYGVDLDIPYPFALICLAWIKMLAENLYFTTRE